MDDDIDVDMDDGRRPYDDMVEEDTASSSSYSS